MCGMGKRASRELLASGEEALTEASTRTGAFAGARSLLEASASQANAEGDRFTAAAAMDRLGMVCHYENILTLISGGEVGEGATAREEALFRQALLIRRDLGDQEGIAQSLFGLGLVSQVLRGDWATAMPLFREAYGITEGLSDCDLYLRSEVHRHLGFYFLVEDRQPAEAVRHLSISLQLREQLGDARHIPSGLVALGRAEIAAGEAGRAVELLSCAVAKAHAAGLLKPWITNAEDTLCEAEAAAARRAES